MATMKEITIPIDSAGRLVVPKELRLQLGLTGPTRLSVSVQNGRIVLQKAETEAGSRLMHKDGVLIHTGKTKRGSPVSLDELDRAREERSNQLHTLAIDD